MPRKVWRIPLWNSGKPPKYVEVDENDFTLYSGYKWRLHKNGYPYRFSEHGPKFLHSEICPAPKGMVTDHEDRDPFNCRRSNLRIVSKSESQWNKGPYKTNTSGYKGVSYDRNRNLWQAAISAYGKRLFLGRFSTARSAAKAYDQEAVKLHGKYAYLNFPRKRV